MQFLQSASWIKITYQATSELIDARSEIEDLRDEFFEYSESDRYRNDSLAAPLRLSLVDSFRYLFGMVGDWVPRISQILC